MWIFIGWGILGFETLISVAIVTKLQSSEVFLYYNAVIPSQFFVCLENLRGKENKQEN